MKYKKYIWIFFIFAITCAVVYYIRKQKAVEGFMTEDEFVTEANHRIKTMQTIKASINDSLNTFDKSAKDTCDLTTKYRDAFVSATAALPKYASLTNDERQKSARAEYDEQRINYIASGNPIYECFATQDEVDAVTKKLKSEMKELSDLLDSPRLRTMLQKGKLLTGLQGLNSTFSGSKMVFEAFVANEDLLESADYLIKQARSVQTVARVAITNTSTLQSDLAKIPDFVKNRFSNIFSNIVDQSTSKLDISGPFKVLVLADSIGLRKFFADLPKDINIEFTILPNTKDQLMNVMNTFSKYRVIVYTFVYNTPIIKENLDFSKYIDSGGNMIFADIWDKDYIFPQFSKYISFNFNTAISGIDSLKIKSKKDHPIINKDITDKEIRNNGYAFNVGRVSVINNDELIANASTQYFEPIPLVAVKTIKYSRIVSLNLSINTGNYNDICNKLLTQCILWAAGRI